MVPIGLAASEGDPFEDMDALVDTGAFYGWIPRPTLERLGVRPTGVRTFTLATGEDVDEQIGYAWIRLQNQTGPTIVVFAPDDSEPLLGAYTLEGFALAADPVNERLVPMPKLRAYGATECELGAPRAQS